MITLTAHVQQQEQQQQQRCEGTPAYLPPEAFSTTSSATSSGLYSNGTDPLQDAWALGCLLHFCCYGKPRFFGEEVDEIRAQQSIWFEERAEKEQGWDAIHGLMFFLSVALHHILLSVDWRLLYYVH